MAGEIPDLHALVRTGTGKGAARQARREGLVPGIVYGGGVDPLPVNIPYNMLFKKLKEGRFLSTLFNLKVDGQDDARVICRGVQRDVVAGPSDPRRFHAPRTGVQDQPLHRRRCRGPGQLSGHQARWPAGYGGGPEVELIVTAGEIPESITINVEGLEIGDTVTISSVTLPEGTKPTIDRDFVIANIGAPSGLATAAEEEEEEGEEIEGEEIDAEEAEEEGGDEE